MARSVHFLNASLALLASRTARAAHLPSCASLPAFPTLPELETSGFLVSVPVVDLTVGVLFAVAGGCVFLPQCIKFVRARSVRGSSPLMIVLSMVTTCFQLAGTLNDALPVLFVCSKLDPWRCCGNTLPFQQLLLQAIGTTGVFLTYTCLRWREGIASPACSGQRWCMVSRAVAPFAIALGAPLAFVAVAAARGPCTHTIQRAHDAILGMASVLQALVMLPQIVLLCYKGELGSLSMATVILQGLGSTVYGVVLLFEREHLLDLVPFAVMSVECMLIVVMVYYFEARRQAALLNGA